MKKLIIGIVLFFSFGIEAWGGVPQMSLGIQYSVYKAQEEIKSENYGRAAQILMDFLAKHPEKNHYMIQFTIADALFLSGKEKESLFHYQNAATLYPEYAPAWQNIGKIYFESKQYNDAGNAFLESYNVSKRKNSLILYYAAISYVLAGDKEKALPHLEYLTFGKAGQPEIEWLEALLKVYLELNLEDKAFHLIQQLINKDNDNPKWWKFLAYCHLQRNNYKEAISALTICSFLAPLKTDEIIMLGDLNNAIGLPLRAAEYYEKAIVMQDSTKPYYYEKLASTYILAHRPQKAREVLERALASEETSKLWFMMGQILYQKEHFDAAHKAFEKSSLLDKKDGRPLLMSGYCALQMNKIEFAKGVFEKASRYPDQQKAAQKLIKQLTLLQKQANQINW